MASDTPNFSLHKSADSALKKFLFDEWRFRIGQMVIADDVETAKKMAASTLTVLNFSEQFLNTHIAGTTLQTDLAGLQLGEFNAQFPNGQQNQLMVSSAAEKTASLQEWLFPTKKSNKKASKVGFAERDSSLTLPSPKPANRASNREKIKALCLQWTHDEHVVLVCGNWPRMNNDGRNRVISFLDETPVEIRDLLAKQKTLTPGTKSVSIAPNTKWAKHHAIEKSIQELHAFFEWIHKQCPDARTKLAGFYAKNVLHFVDFNCRLKRICDRLGYVEFVEFEKLVKPNEIFLCSSGGLRPDVIFNMFKCLAEY